MPHSLADERARNALQTKLVSALHKARACGDLLYTWEDQFDAFEAEAIKAVGNWMNEGDLMTLLMTNFRVHIPREVADSNDTVLVKEMTSTETIDSIAESVVSFLARMPIPYDVSFPLPSFPTITDEIILSDRVKFAPRTVLGAHVKPEGAEIVVRANGFAMGSLQHSAAREAASILKITLGLGALRKVFRERRTLRRQLPSLLPVEFTTEVSHFIFIREAGSQTGTRIKMGTGLSKYLDSLGWADRLGDEFPQGIQDLANPLNMIYHPDAETNVKTIRRAIEWQFDAVIDEDATMRFLKHCIGLEALLAEQSEDMGITEQLADRCAFLLSKTPDERARRRLNVREVYKLRSKIVHGSISGLSHKDTVTSHRASNLLQSLLTVELESVRTWWDGRIKRVKAE